MGLTRQSTGRGAVENNDFKLAPGEKLIAVAGNPNVGKSTLFNALTGMRQHTGNWPGKTVTSAWGRCQTPRHACLMADIPGAYSLLAHSKEEEVARDFLLSNHADAVIAVCDATCLERNLILVLQILSVTRRVVVCVNLMDEAARRGVLLNLPLLESRLGVPVIGITARCRQTLAPLMEALDALLDAVSVEPPSTPNLDQTPAEAFVTQAESLCREVVIQPAPPSLNQRLDRLITGKWTAFPLMLGLLLGVFWLTITGANFPSQWLSQGFEWLLAQLEALLAVLSLPGWLQRMALDVARVVSWIVSVMLPPMAIFFPLFTLMEDIGLLPRIAYNLDRPFQACSACGKQALCMAMGLGCNAAGVVGCRIIHSPRERLIAILTNAFMPCNGRFPTLIVLWTLFFIPAASGWLSSLIPAAGITLLLILGVGLTLAVSKLLSKTLLKGLPSAFVLELPPYRKPQWGQVLIRSLLDRTLFVLGRAVTVAIPAGLMIHLMANLTLEGTTLLAHCTQALDPLGRLLGMDGVILMAFLLGLPANEIVLPLILMAYAAESSLTPLTQLASAQALLAAHGWTWHTALCVMLFSLCHWPCSTTLLTIHKETGSWKWTGLAALIPTLAGFLLCAGANLIFRLIG